MAKELAMVEKTDKGRQARRYFIDCERRAKGALPDLAPSPAAPHPAESPLLLLEGELVRLRASAAFFQDMTEVLNTLAYARGVDGVSSGMAGALRTVAGSSGELLGRIAGIVDQVRGRTLDAVKEAMAAGRINPAEAAVRSARAAKAARARWDKERDQNAAVPKSKKGSGSTH